jgi:branched-subunit amino acid transport protein
MSTSTGWLIVLLSGVGCYALKFAGYAMPPRWFQRPALRRGLELMPVALLAALIVVQTLASGRHYDLDWPRLAGLGVAVVAIRFGANFIVIIVAAAATAALLRLA